MAQLVTKKTKAVLSGGLHPHYRDVVSTLMDQTDQPHVAAPVDLTRTEDLSDLIDDQTACVVVQNPSVLGQLRALSGLARDCQAKGAQLLVVVIGEIGRASGRERG